MEEKLRIKWIDVMKGLLMTAVVWGHVYSTGNFRLWLYSFHVPAFFFISGFCFSNNNDLKALLAKKIRTIVVPYLFFSVASIMFWFLSSKLWPSLDRVLECDFLINCKTMLFGTSKPDIMKYNSPLWFLPCLFCVNVYYILIRLLSDKYSKSIEYIVFLFAICCNVYFSWHDTRYPWHMDTAVSMLVWFMLGNWFKEKNIIALIENRITNKLSIGIIILILGGLLSFFNSCTVGVRNENYGLIPIYYFSALSSILGLILVSHELKLGALEEIGKNTLSILCIHKFIIVFFEGISIYMNFSIKNVNEFISIILGAGVTAISISISLIIGRICTRYIPSVLGRK